MLLQRCSRFGTTAAITAISSLLAVTTATAQDAPVEGVPVDKSIDLRPAYSPLAEEVNAFHDFVIFPVMVAITLFVLGLLIWVVIRYNSKANPEPNRFSHNTTIEVVWTVVPVAILLYVAVFSFDLLFIGDKMPDGQITEYEEGATTVAIPNEFPAKRQVTKRDHLEAQLINLASGETRMLSAASDYSVEGYGEENVVLRLAEPVPAGHRLRVTAGRSRIGQKKFLGLFGDDTARIIPSPTVTIKATGFQWGWTYNYPDFSDFEFDSLMAEEGSVPSHLYRLAVDNDIVVPVGETIRILTTGRDVIHSWSMPEFAVKIDAIPGRINETWFYAQAEGTYYGQCTEICGINHAFMPVAVRVVSRPEFEAWVNEQLDYNGLPPAFATRDQLAAVDTDGPVFD